MDIRIKGDWENWLKFFLKGIAEISVEAADTAKNILTMKEDHSRIITSSFQNPTNALKLLDLLFEHPIVTVNMVKDTLNISYPTSKSLIGDFANLGILIHNPETQRNKKYTYQRYIQLLEAGTEI